MTEPIRYRIVTRAPDPDQTTDSEDDGGGRASCMVLLDADDSNFYNGMMPYGLYVVRFGRRTPRLTHRIADFLRYESALGRTTIVWSEYPCDVDQTIQKALRTTPAPRLRREYDPLVAVHSTPENRVAGIVGAGEIRPASMLRRAGTVVRPVGFEVLGEPPEYIDMVHFTELGSATGEVVVLSHRDGRINTNFSAPYTPGARIYVDFDRLLSAGILCRDGLHVAMTRGPVSLERYAIDLLTEGDLPPRSEPWTPASFAEAADTEFRVRHPGFTAADRNARIE